jgi:hypothetical protein
VEVVEQHRVIQEDTELVVLVVVELEILAVLQGILEQQTLEAVVVEHQEVLVELVDLV